MMDEVTIRVAIRTTARISFLLFLGAVLGNAFYRLAPVAATRWLKANKDESAPDRGNHHFFLAIVSKLISRGLPLLGEGWATVLKARVGTTPRGQVALIVALVGLQSQILSPSAYGIIVLMTIVTTLLNPPVLRYLFHVERRPVPKEAATPTVTR